MARPVSMAVQQACPHAGHAWHDHRRGRSIHPDTRARLQTGFPACKRPPEMFWFAPFLIATSAFPASA